MEGDTGGGGDVYGKVGWRYSITHERPHRNDQRMEFAVAPDRARLAMTAAKSISSGTIGDVLNLLEPW